MKPQKKIKAWIHKIIMMTKEEKIQPIIVPTDKEKLLDGKVALITGGSSGIGLAIAKAFMDSGAKVIIAGTNETKLLSALEGLEKRGGTTSKGLIINVRDVETLPDKVKEAAALFEENRIDILVNSAGVVTKHNFWDTDEAEYDSIMETKCKRHLFHESGSWKTYGREGHQRSYIECNIFRQHSVRRGLLIKCQNGQ